MYYKLNDNELETIKKVNKLTFTDYELLGDFIPVDSFISIIEDLIYEIDRIEEEFNDFKRDVEDNYRPLTPRELGWE